MSYETLKPDFLPRNMPIDEKPSNDILKLSLELSHIYQLEKENASLQSEIQALKEEVERLSKRDCNATIELLYETKEQPFERETLKVVDVGVADNIYCVESELVKQLQSSLDAAQEREKELVEGLRKLEWWKLHNSLDKGDFVEYCAGCDATKEEGHKPDCWLSALIEGRE